MEIIGYIIALLAAVAASAMIVNVLPFSIDTKLNPWLMFGSALLALTLPHLLVYAMAMTVPMGLIYGWTGIRLQGHEPVKIPVEQIKELAKRIKVPKKREVREFLTREFPVPESSVKKFVPEL